MKKIDGRKLKKKFKLISKNGSKNAKMKEFMNYSRLPINQLSEILIAIMNEAPKYPINWRNFLFFASFFIIAVIGVPIYIYTNGLNLFDVLFFLFWTFASGMGITIGYHRLFAHKTFKSHPFVVFLGLFFGAAAFEESALEWASQHRDHHKYVDTEKDPYNIMQGFWYAHIGWIIFRNHSINYENVKDLQMNKMIIHQDKYYVWWALTAGVILPLLIGALMGHALSALLIGVFGRVTFVHHGTFLINSACHYFGPKTYNARSSARDNWIAALFTYGEGYHSFHHRFPSDYRNGHKWYHWDPSKWLISALSHFGLTSDLKQVSKFNILAARLIAEKELAENYLKNHSENLSTTALNALKSRYEHLKDILNTWEYKVREYATLAGQLSNKSDDLLRSAFEQVQATRRQFISVREQWVQYIQKPSLLCLVQS